MVPSNGDEVHHVVKLRGLPYSTSISEVLKWLDGIVVKGGESGIHMMTSGGRPAGEAFVELESAEDLALTMKLKGTNLGTRYIEIFNTPWEQVEQLITGNTEQILADHMVRLRGLPFGTKENEIREFLTGCAEIKSVKILTGPSGQPSGEAIVRLGSEGDVSVAIGKHKEHLGHRYVEVFRVKPHEIHQNGVGGPRGGGFGGRGGGFRGAYARPGPYDRPPPYDGYGGGYGGGPMRGGGGPYGRGGFGDYGPRGGGYGGVSGWFGQKDDSPTPHKIKARGLPFSCTVDDVHQFFEGITVAEVHLLYNPQGKPSGEAQVYFNSDDDAQEGMKNHKKNMGSRYVELFLHSKPVVALGGGGPLKSRNQFMQSKPYAAAYRSVMQPDSNFGPRYGGGRGGPYGGGYGGYYGGY